ncbi:MAG: TraR/DksA C4-type zinc finger protein [Acidimicrobiales bacterium]
MSTDDGAARERLAAERARLQEVRDSFAVDNLQEESEQENLSDLSAYDQHQADVGTETFEREKDLSILEGVEAELNDVEHALARLDDGTYGTCEACGEPIGDERLQAMPAARFCVRHQADAERQTRARS